MKDNYTYLDVDRHTSLPTDNFVWILRDRYWIVRPGKGLKIYLGSNGRAYSPQCNSSEALVVGLANDGEEEVRFIPFVWLPHDCKDYI